jgi:hypothetical protein
VKHFGVLERRMLRARRRLIASVTVMLVAALVLYGICVKRLVELRRENERLGKILDDCATLNARLLHESEEYDCLSYLLDCRRMCCEMQLGHFSTCEPGEKGELAAP